MKIYQKQINVFMQQWSLYCIFPLRFIGIKDGYKCYESKQKEFSDCIFIFKGSAFICNWDPGKLEITKLKKISGYYLGRKG